MPTPTVEEVARGVTSEFLVRADDAVWYDRMVERITQTLTQAHKESYVRGLREAKEIAEKVELNNMYGQPKGEGSIRFEIALNIDLAIQSAIDKANTAGER